MGPAVKIISYYRVSTKRQGQSGLGLDAQRAAVEAYAKQSNASIIGSYVEVESGRKNDRPVLRQAIAHAKLSRSTLCVAKLDRLSRNAGFLLTLQESGLRLVFCDLPGANEMTIGVMALVARQERQAISERTKAALQAAKRRGVLLGSARPGHWEGREDRRDQRKASQAAAVARHKATREAYSFLMPTIREMRTSGHTFDRIATALNSEGHTTRTGMPWTATAALRVWRMAKTEE
jgi:DNA invertase Pin-like site-specific DNA recombinase